MWVAGPAVVAAACYLSGLLPLLLLVSGRVACPFPPLPAGDPVLLLGLVVSLSSWAVAKLSLVSVAAAGAADALPAAGAARSALPVCRTTRLRPAAAFQSYLRVHPPSLQFLLVLSPALSATIWPGKVMVVLYYWLLRIGYFGRIVRGVLNLPIRLLNLRRSKDKAIALCEWRCLQRSAAQHASLLRGAHQRTTLPVQPQLAAGCLPHACTHPESPLLPLPLAPCLSDCRHAACVRPARRRRLHRVPDLCRIGLGE